MNIQMLPVKYVGYDTKRGIFVFELKDSKFYLYASEVSWNSEAPKLIQEMKDKVGKLFRLIFYHFSYGYYVEYENGKYNIHDGVTEFKVSDGYNSLDDIPKYYNNKPVYKYKRKAILGEIVAK